MVYCMMSDAPLLDARSLLCKTLLQFTAHLAAVHSQTMIRCMLRNARTIQVLRLVLHLQLDDSHLLRAVVALHARDRLLVLEVRSGLWHAFSRSYKEVLCALRLAERLGLWIFSRGPRFDRAKVDQMAPLGR